MQKDLYNAYFEHMSEDIKEIKEGIKSIQDDLKGHRKEVEDIRLQQASCNKNWGYVGKVLSWGGGGGIVGFLVTQFGSIFPKGN